MFYFGGFLDSQTDNVLSSFRNFISLGGNAQYFSYNQISQMVASATTASRQGEIIDIVGHSYGGSAAINAAALLANNGVAVHSLITIDPVQGRINNDESSAAAASVNTSYWINVTASPGVLSFNLSDVVALLGGKAPESVTDLANKTIVVDAHHADFTSMLAAALSGASVEIQTSYTPTGSHIAIPTRIKIKIQEPDKPKGN